jgi:AcrR family transcriptional regulator
MTRKGKQSTATQAVTRKALLEAGAEIFAQRGFTAATVREICDRAQANIAAINYHFGDKAGLYAEVLKHALHCARQKYPPHLGTTEKSTAEERLHAFIQSLLLRLFDEGRHAWHGKLMSREMVEPTAALDDLVQEEIRPMANSLRGIVRELMGPDASEEAVRMCSLSVVSQCLFYHQCRPVLQRLFPKMKINSESARQLAEHITSFSLGAIKAAKQKIRRSS